MLSYHDLQQITNKPETELCEIMNRNLSDKGNGHHNYTKLYHHLFEKIRHKPLDILEIGIGSINPQIQSNMCGYRFYTPGASIRGWHEYFPNSNIYACDIDNSILNFSEKRIKGFYLDQTNEELLTSIVNNGFLKDKKFDIIIDDGLHEWTTNFKVMRRLLPLLKEQGYYFIESIPTPYYDYRYIDFNVLAGKEYQYIKLPNEKNTWDNNLFMVHNF